MPTKKSLKVVKNIQESVIVSSESPKKKESELSGEEI
jgi:hypothetical protein